MLIFILLVLLCAVVFGVSWPYYRFRFAASPYDHFIGSIYRTEYFYYRFNDKSFRWEIYNKETKNTVKYRVDDYPNLAQAYRASYKALRSSYYVD